MINLQSSQNDLKELQKERQEQVDSVKISRVKAMKNAFEERKLSIQKIKEMRQVPLAKNGEARPIK
jgi:hypothetical protein